jgi:hypothetical protein
MVNTMSQFKSEGTLSPSQKKLVRHKIADEKRDAKKYSKMGFTKLSKSERSHAKYLKRFLK